MQEHLVPTLEMKEITKRFAGVTALDSVSFKAYAGEILALVGENGAGKSTLMKILSGSYPFGSYEGQIFIDNKEVKFQSSAKSENEGIAMIYQEISMHLDLTIAENIFLGRWITRNGKILWHEMKKEAEKYLSMVHLEADPDMILRQLSASQQQLVAIARALSKNPKILILDEPTASLTQEESGELYRILQGLKEKGTTIILITHRLDEVFENADRITVLRDGKIISSDKINKISQKQVIFNMVGREIHNYYPKAEIPVGEVVFEAKHFTVPHPYAKKNIVEDVSFSVRKGEILGIAGLVGAGRSELVEAIFGKRKKTNGEVWLNGEHIEIKKPADAIRNGIGLVTEDRRADGFIGIHSIRDNAILVSMRKLFPHHIVDLQKADQETKKYFDILNIKAPGIFSLVQQLSGGNQQKVVLAKWMMNDPQILIMDEPTRGIDVDAKTEIYKTMMTLVKKGVSIIMISSELPEILNISDRVIVIGNGRITGEFSKEEMTESRIMEAAVD